MRVEGGIVPVGRPQKCLRVESWRENLRKAIERATDPNNFRLCPACGNPQVVRQNRSNGDDFWGCSLFRFTGCKGKRVCSGADTAFISSPGGACSLGVIEETGLVSPETSETGTPTRTRHRRKDRQMSVIHTGNGTVTYEAVRKAMRGKPYPMSLTDTDESSRMQQDWVTKCDTWDRCRKHYRRRDGSLVVHVVLEGAVAVQCSLRSAPITFRQSEPTMTRCAIVFVLAAVIHLGNAVAAEDTQQTMPTESKVRPIGHVQKMAERIVIILDKKYQEGLLGLEHWSHVQVIWWFDKNDTPEKRAILQVHPRGDATNPLTGVFATRSPFRPNLIALSLCKIVSVKDNVVEVEKIDAFEGTPVLDIKPYAPGQDLATEVRVSDWAKPK